MALNRANITVVDDDGTETTGTVFDAEFFDALYDAIDEYAALLGPSENIPFFNMAGPTAERTFTFPDADATVFTSAGIANTALKIYDTNASHFLSIVPGSDLSADRTLTITTGDAARTITLSGNPTLSDWFDQSVKQAASPTFAGLVIGATTISETEIGYLDGLTPGTVTASKALVVDANKDLASIRNLTLTGTQQLANDTYVIGRDVAGTGTIAMFGLTALDILRVGGYQNGGVADSATIDLSTSSSAWGFAFISGTGGEHAIVALRGGSNATSIVSDPSSLFSTTKDTASKVNVYFETDRYKLQNKRGASRQFRIVMIGVGGS